MFFKVFGGHMSFLGATGTPVLDLSPLGFKARVDSALLTFCEDNCHVHSPRSTSGATLTNLSALSLLHSYVTLNWPQ